MTSTPTSQTVPPTGPAPGTGDRLDAARELHLLLKSRAALVFLDTAEEERALHMVSEAALACARQLYTWSVTHGLQRHGDPTIHRETCDPAQALGALFRQGGNSICLMRDLAPNLSEPMVQRLMVDIAHKDEVTLVLTGAHGEIPDSLRIHSAVLEIPRPDVALIDQVIRTQLQMLHGQGRPVNELTESQIGDLARALRGLTLEEVEQVLTRLIELDGRLSVEDIAAALEHKSNLLARSGVVELCTPTHGLDWVAGFEHLKPWAETRGRAFSPEAEKFGLPAPKGVLLTGVPGCGKSYVVKALAHDWRMPLLRLDAGSLFDKFVGSSEKNLRDAFTTAEALSPSILWIDEIEKGFSSTGPSESDGGLAYRLVGMLATWMQERPVPVFVAATSNNITILPPELTRQGRFDEVFFVDLPEEAERQHLFAIQLARRSRDYRQFDCAALAAAAEGFSGSEIEQSVSNALYVAFAQTRDLTTADVLGEVAATRPLSRVSPDKIAAMRAWGAEHARPS